MKFLLDMPVSQRTAVWLRAEGHDALHVRDIGLARAADAHILQRAAQEGRVVITMDLDFPHLLSSLSAEGPGVILIRLRRPSPNAIQEGLAVLFRTYAPVSLTGAIAVLEEARIRLHRLPIR